MTTGREVASPVSLRPGRPGGWTDKNVISCEPKALAWAVKKLGLTARMKLSVQCIFVPTRVAERRHVVTLSQFFDA